MFRPMIAVICLVGGVAAAQDWKPMTGSEIESSLNDRKLRYANAWQEFYASGKTLYNHGRPSWGYWQVRGDQYCSQWPPNNGWDCYDMETDGINVRFIGRNNDVTEGHFEK